ncbi:MAG TPA: acyl-CoA dehydratase activase-related protein [Bacillota bacterium]|nr:acyl-CoA dehydratase activase-related protein [Bacillota bacterium]
MKLGIPRTFFFYYYYPFWSVLFQSLGFELVLSPPTNSAILEDGIGRALEEYCLPVKIHRGHVAWLEDKCDYIFSPGYGRSESRGFFCPKLIGMPDIIRAAHSSSVTFWHDFDGNGSLDRQQWSETLRSLDSSLSEPKIIEAWRTAVEEEKAFFHNTRNGVTITEGISRRTGERPPLRPTASPNYRLAIIGHPYLVYDPWICGRLFETLHHYGAELLFQENIPEQVIGKKWPFQHKRVYWPVGQETLTSALYYIEEGAIDGIIQISSCLCGPDAIVSELLGKYVHRREGRPFPLLQLTVDEHTGWAGLQTRVEAFMDLLDWRRGHVSL